MSNYQLDMRAYYFGGLLVSLLFIKQNSALAQQRNVAQTALGLNAKVDSVFKSNFRSIEQKLRKNQDLAPSESNFVYVAGFISGIDFNLESYTGIPILTLTKLTEFENCYSKNQARIAWSNLTRGLTIVNLPPTDETINELNSLRIK